MQLRTDGTTLVDEHGRQRILHGINLVAKGPRGQAGVPGTAFRGDWSDEDLAGLARSGLDAVRLGVIWAAVEPEPGRYDTGHLAWLEDMLDRLHRAGLAVVLDAHQDLYSQSFGDGAPAWATLTAQPFTPSDLWSDAYVSSAAVQEALDAFWADAPGPDGMGIRTRFTAMWGELARRLGGHPAVIGYDVLNEPAPGALMVEVQQAILGALAERTGQAPEQVAADLSDPAARLAQLARLEDESLHRAVADAAAPLLAPFEQGPVHDLFRQAAAAIREHRPGALILREHSYPGNLGVPAAIPPLDGGAWAYSPHGYDLVVDTEAMSAPSDRRVTTILTRAAETAAGLGVPVIVGEWGGLGDLAGIGAHIQHQLDLFDRWAWSWFYWSFDASFPGSEAARHLRRPRAVAVTGRGLRAESSAGGGWKAAWDGAEGPAPTEFWVPEEQDVELVVDGARASILREGARVLITPRPGEHRLRVL
ncbi:hypothetical protein BF93_11310 [Brachybacterium phenoliresistens]|uniref:Glycoside hydrolase family 5 domain-containing protein n=1 Tax=Brachybacterium phenoliresistens TaxID=396014 RepID=Z9JWT0_9MICO|nr:cellulase family glycosylhydrolase [Brachybacterium phenoliresistens]EWS82458.1 hypothetical protein BF93_11310 [Brachybacterium phenoliresistens]